jgi:proteasomal ATPase-associated factor 1
LWNVAEGKEVRKWSTEGRAAVGEILLDQTEEVIMAFKTDGGVEVFEIQTGRTVGRLDSPMGGLNCAAWDRRTGTVAVGYTNGAIHLRKIDLRPDGVEVKSERMVRRNAASIYSLAWTPEGDLLVGTAAGLPCRLGVRSRNGQLDVEVQEEIAGWEAVGVEAWAVGLDGGIWCAGGEGGIRRY